MDVNKIIELHPEPKDIQVLPANILELLGYADMQSDEHIDELIANCLEVSKQAFEPAAWILLLKKNDVNIQKGEIYCNNHILKTDRLIASRFKNADYLAVFVCTIGKKTETLSKEMMNSGNLLEGYIFDLIGSEAAEATASLVHQSVNAIAAREHLSVSNRYSPGYCNWNVEEQFKIFSFFQEDNIGISLNSSALMNPVKSVSGIIGIGHKVKFHQYSCAACSDEKCIYRNKKNALK